MGGSALHGVGGSALHRPPLPLSALKVRYFFMVVMQLTVGFGRRRRPIFFWGVWIFPKNPSSGDLLGPKNTKNTPFLHRRADF